MNAKMADGSARCADHCDGVPSGLTADACLYCGQLSSAPAAPVEITGRLAEGDAEYIGYKPHPRRITPGTMGRQMIAWSGRVREIAAQRGMSVQDVLCALPPHLFAR